MSVEPRETTMHEPLLPDLLTEARQLGTLARTARMLHLGLTEAAEGADAAAHEFRTALELAMDAESSGEEAAAEAALVDALRGLRRAGLAVSAELSEMDVDGVLGAAKLAVLTALLSPASQSAPLAGN